LTDFGHRPAHALDSSGKAFLRGSGGRQRRSPRRFGGGLAQLDNGAHAATSRAAKGPWYADLARTRGKAGTVMTMAIDREIERLGDEELLDRLRKLVVRSNATEAELIAHLAEVDERRLYLPRRTSLWDFCLLDLGFSENVAANRIAVARESRQFPRMLEMLRQGRIHLSGLRMLYGHLTTEGSEELLAEAVGKTKRQIEELLARRYPKPAVPDRIRKLPSAAVSASTSVPEPAPLLSLEAPAPPPRAVVAPLSAEAYRVQFTASPELRDKIRQAQELLRHQLPSGDLAPILERALTLLIAQVKKERFGVGRKPRSGETRQSPARSRRVPTAIRRAVYERDGGRCTYVDPEGRSCDSEGFLQLDHVEGFARKVEHRVESIRLLCSAHNQHAADGMYGKQWMERKRRQGKQRARSSEPERDAGPEVGL
jgi:hypothetical protein